MVSSETFGVIARDEVTKQSLAYTVLRCNKEITTPGFVRLAMTVLGIAALRLRSARNDRKNHSKTI